MNEEINNLTTSSDEEEEYLKFTLKKTTILAVLLPIFFLTGLLVGYITWGGEAEPVIEEPVAVEAPTQAPAENEVIAQEPTRYEVTINENDPVFGPEDAPITIIEFSDYSCPYCRRHFMETTGKILENYQGQIRLIFKDFPLTDQSDATPVTAAAAAHCAAEQGAFWGFHDLLFEMEFELGSEAYQEYANQLSLDMAAFNECVAEGRYIDAVLANRDYAARLGVRSTPTFFINGIPLVGAQPYEVFAQIIESELAGSN